MKYLLAIISIALGSLAQYYLKLGMTGLPCPATVTEKLIYVVTNIHVWIGLTCYGMSMVFWLYVLSVVELSKAYPLVSLGYLFTFALSYFLLDESIGLWRILGMIFIMLGVVLIVKS